MRAATPYKQLNSNFKEIPFRLSSADEAFKELEGEREEQLKVAKNGLLDVADRKKVEQLEKFKKMAEQAAHDIRTPLQTLSMALDYRFKNLTEEERILLKTITNKIKKIAQVLLEPSKKENSADRQHIQISQILDEIVNQKEIQYIGKNIEFQYSFDPSVGFTFIYGNAINFERMISNIINNSVEAFDGKKGIVKVSFTTDKDNVKITIQDNGIGMPQEIVEKLMQGKSISTTKVGGHGEYNKYETL